MQQSGESDPDRWGVDEALENLAWDEYFPKEVLDRLEGGRPDVKVFRDVLIEYLERDYAGKNETSPPFSHADYVKAMETEQYEEIVEKKVLADRHMRESFARLSWRPLLIRFSQNRITISVASILLSKHAVEPSPRSHRTSLTVTIMMQVDHAFKFGPWILKLPRRSFGCIHRYVSFPAF